MSDNFDKLILDALKESLDEDKFQELMKALNPQTFAKRCGTVVDAWVESTKRLGLGGIQYDNIYRFECFDMDGNFKWDAVAHNLVVDEGLVHTLDVVLYSTAKTSNWYFGLTTGSPAFDATDTMASGLPTEYTNYSNGTRYQLDFSPGATDLSPSGAQLDASQISYTISSPGGTVGGGFICSVDTKGGTSGLLYGGAGFTGGDKSVSTSDTLNVDVTVNATST
jgi:hypothetical protein